MKPLTAKQSRVLNYIAAQDIPPTVREIAEEFGIQVNGVTNFLRILERKGHIYREPGKSRSIVVVGDPRAVLSDAMRRGSLAGVELTFAGRTYRIVEERGTKP